MLTPSTTKPAPDEDIDSLSPSQNHSADQVAGEKGDSSDGADAFDDSKLPLPVQKRRRVTRACDECRRKKIKCDGKQPCTHCTVYSYGILISASVFPTLT
jgi:Fungal Zn(2)-Cys(6) binuclear cluster domain